LRIAEVQGQVGVGAPGSKEQASTRGPPTHFLVYYEALFRTFKQKYKSKCVIFKTYKCIIFKTYTKIAVLWNPPPSPLWPPASSSTRILRLV